MAKIPAPQPPVGDLTFEQALEELDALVRRMESGQLGLDDSIAAYQRGAELAKYCQARLAAAEEQIKVLDGDVLKPLDPGQMRGTQGNG
jgi:exodeoxyribonuclease VII small subunit